MAVRRLLPGDGAGDGISHGKGGHLGVVASVEGGGEWIALDVSSAPWAGPLG